MQGNDTVMKSEITGETHFEDVENVASQNIYTTAQTASIRFNIIDKCGFYSDNCRDWRRKAKLK